MNMHRLQAYQWRAIVHRHPFRIWFAKVLRRFITKRLDP